MTVEHYFLVTFPGGMPAWSSGVPGNVASVNDISAVKERLPSVLQDRRQPLEASLTFSNSLVHIQYSLYLLICLRVRNRVLAICSSVLKNFR